MEYIKLFENFIPVDLDKSFNNEYSLYKYSDAIENLSFSVDNTNNIDYMFKLGSEYGDNILLILFLIKYTDIVCTYGHYRYFSDNYDMSKNTRYENYFSVFIGLLKKSKIRKLNEELFNELLNVLKEVYTLNKSNSDKTNYVKYDNKIDEDLADDLYVEIEKFSKIVIESNWKLKALKRINKQ